MVWTEALVEWVRTSCDAVRVEVRSLGVDPASVPEGAVSFAGDPCHPHPAIRVSVETATGLERLTLRPSLDVVVEAPVAVASARPGEGVVWTMGRVSLGTEQGPMVEPGDWVAKASIAAGAVLTSFSVAPRPDVLAGDTLSVRVRSGALEVRSEARLLRDARVGEAVRVFVPATGKVVEGRLVDRTTVEL